MHKSNFSDDLCMSQVSLMLWLTMCYLYVEVLCVMTSCSDVVHPEDGGSMVLQNTGVHNAYCLQVGNFGFKGTQS